MTKMAKLRLQLREELGVGWVGQIRNEDLDPYSLG